MDIRRIPILSLSSTISMTDLMSELPLPTPHVDSLNQSLWYNQEVFNEACKILNSNNSFIFESIAIALSSTSTDEIILKDSIENSSQINLSAVPSVFRQMVQRDQEKFKNKNGFQDFFIKEPKTIVNKIPSDSITPKAEKTEKLPKKKKKKRKEITTTKDTTVKNDSEAYVISHKSNGLCFSFKKIKPPLDDDPKLSNSSQSASLPNKVPDNSVIVNQIQPVEPANLVKSLSIPTIETDSTIITNVTHEEPFNTTKHITLDYKLKDNNGSLLNDKQNIFKSAIKHCTVDENYFTSLNHSNDVFNSKSLFESDVSSLKAIDTQNATEDFLDSSGFKSNPHSNSLSTHELQLTDSTVKANMLGIDYNRSDLTNNSPLHDDSQSYQQNNQQFGLAAYLTKTTNSNNANIDSCANNTDNQPGSCLSAGQNSFDNYDLKNSDASISESANPNGPNSAFSEVDLQDRKIEKRSRGRNKELENLKRWQIKDKGMPHADDNLDSATVGPGERVKKRTRRCVKRNEREDCSSMSEHSYHTADVSPAAPETAQINHSESSLEDENRLSPAVTQSSPFESNYELFNNLPSKENAQSKSAIDFASADLNFNSTDIASSLASITPDEELPEILSQSKSKIKGKKLPSKADNKLSGKTQSSENYIMNNNQGSLPVEIMGNISDESSDDSSSDFSAKCKSKVTLKNNKKSKKTKNSYFKPNSNSESRFQHLYTNKEEKIQSRERIFRASQYDRNMNPYVVLSPLPDNIGYHELDSPSSSNTASTMPFTYDPDLDILNNDADQFSCNLSKPYESIKNQFFNFLDSLLKDVEELDLLNIASNNKNSTVSGFFRYNEHDAKLSLKNLNLLNSYIAKMKSYKIMNQVPVGKLVRLLTLLLVNMNSFINVPNDSKKKVQKILQEQLLSCLDASLIALSIMISPDMPRAVFLEDVIEQACDLFRTVMRYIIYPAYDNTVKCQPNPNDVLLNIISNLNVNKSQSNFLTKLYSRVQCGINCLSELMHQQPSRLTDEAVLKLTSLAISSLSVNINDIQFSIIPLLAAAFCQYEGHRKSIIGELLSIMTHSQGKKIVRTYKINSEEEIQTISAVILILFQSVVQKPKSNKKSHSSKQSSADSGIEQSIISTLNSSHKIMQIFIHTFFKKVCFKGEDNYKIAFERFLQDLFLMYNKPEWPAVNSLLNCIGTTLVYHLNTSQTNRTVPIDLLGTICSFMYRHVGLDNYKSKSINEILKELIIIISKNSQTKVQSELNDMNDDDQVRLLKSLLLNFLTLDSSDFTCMYAKRYYVGIWLHEMYNINDNGAQCSKKDLPTDSVTVFCKVEEEFKKTLFTQLNPNSCSIYTSEITELSYENCFKIARLLSQSKDMQCFELYLSRICKSLDEISVPARTKAMRSLTLVLEEDPSLLMKNEIEKSVNKRFLDSSISVREATVDLIGKFLLQKPKLINQYYPVLINRIVDTGTSVRKRVIKVLWDICSSQNDFTNSAEVYAKIMKRMYDEESIKKLVNDVFRSIWFSPISDKDPVKLQQRIFNIADVIHSLGHDQKCNHNWVLQFITQLSKTEKENTDTKCQKSFEKSFQQIVEFLVQTVLRLQEVSSNTSESNPTITQNSKSVLSSQQKLLCSTWSALHIFAKVKPKLVWPYLSDLSVLLRQIRSPEHGSNLKQTLTQNNDMAICMNHLCGTLDAGLSAVQSFECLEYSNINLTKDNLMEIANDLINLATNAPKRFIVDSVIKCLSKVTNFTQEFSSVRNFFSKFFGSAMRMTDQLKQNPKQWKVNDSKSASLGRILYTSVALCRCFEMSQLLQENMLSQANSVFSRLLDITIYCAENFPKNCELRNKAIFNMNHLVHKDRQLLINGPIHKFYIKTLNLIQEEHNLSGDTSRVITFILDNINNFLKHNEIKMVEENANWKSRCQNESLKENNEVSGSFGNIVAQIYFKLVLECCLVGRTEIRIAGLNLVCKILSQGLVQPMLAVGYLIALQGDIDNSIRFKSDSQLTELHSKFPGFLNMKAIVGIRFSYKLQNSISKAAQVEIDKTGQTKPPLVRGWTYLNGNLQTNNGESNGAVNILAINHQLYSSLRKIKQHWRSFLDGMVNMFDESQQCDIREQIFIADQLATFPYQIQEEPIFVVHKLDLLISIVGPTILRCCKDVFKQLSKPIADRAYKDGELTSNEMTILVKLLSESSFQNKQLVYLSIRSSQVSLLMIALKDYIKTVYGIVDSKINNYSPENNNKQWDKQVSRINTSSTFEIPLNCITNLPDLENLKSNDSGSNCIKQLIEDFINFRNKIMCIDPKLKTNENPMTVTNVNESKIDFEKSKMETPTKNKPIESKLDNKPMNISDNMGKIKNKIVRAEPQSDSEISNSTSSDSIKVVTPKKQKIAYSISTRMPISGKEIPNLDIKTSSSTDKSTKVPPNDLRKSQSSTNLSSNSNWKSNKPKSTEKIQNKVTLTTLPSDFLGSSSNNKPKSYNAKSFKTTNNGDSSRTPIPSNKSYSSSTNKSGDHINNVSDRRHPSSSLSYNNVSNKFSSKTHDNNYKRPASPVMIKKPKKRKRMISSSSDSADNSD